MIILDTSPFYQSPRLTLEEFKRLVYNNYCIIMENDSELNLMIHNLFEDKDVKEAINSMSIDKDRNIISENNTKNDLILRYLEYGGESLRAPHILHKSKMQLERRSLNV